MPQVNIQTPNEQGLSHNKYSKFDVDTKGAILNNSRTNVQTQQGGWVQGNPYLARGEAKVILNEVNSSDPSVLKGYVEVAGKKADVIIANPSGIHCDGCGVINSDRTTLTTGKPQIQHGNLENFVVQKGKVSVSGKGLDNSRVDYTEIIAQETQINAGVWSKKEMKVVTGKNTVKRTGKPEDLQIIHTNQATTQETKPQVAIDVGQLGECMPIKFI
ncbi:protein PfhB1 [Rodentibacter pneumotropicus]|uniref:Protein PfhB1 n=1 Tax=Rodentibacter pneumotropicus TaxID=758 RepID=A0A448MQZ2_9PAST|nr:protein PfhB1 [Rodentibacter pneumotropicus]